MNTFNPAKVNVEYRDGVNSYQPVIGRIYTITHSDDTAEMFITVGRMPASDLFNEIRDEVIIEIQENMNNLYFIGKVLIDFPGKDWDSKLRNDIFLREMPKALMALRFADEPFFNENRYLDLCPIYIAFESENEMYLKVYDFGFMKDYKI